LWLRALDSFDARQLRETGGGFQPFWSPDNQSIAFFAERKLYRLEVATGERREICPFTGNARGGSWSASGSIIFATTNPQSLMRVASQGGKPAPIRLSGAENHLGPISWPSFLPDGRRFLYSVRTKAGAVGTIYLASIESDTDVRMVVTSDTQAVFVAPGYLLFGRDTRLLYQAFDVERGQVSGDAVAVVDRMRMMTQIALASSRRPTPACWRIGRGWMRPINSPGSIVRECLSGPSEHPDDIAHQPCHLTGGDWSIPISMTTI